MTDSEAAERAAVVAEAHSWLGTPYHTGAGIKGVGTDCAFLSIRAYADAGVLPEIQPAHYPMDFALHRSAEIYLSWAQRYGQQIDGPPDPGDLVVWKFGRCFSHGAIVVAWPIIIHALIKEGVTLGDASRDQRLLMNGSQKRERLFFTLWPH
jgi:cell wall-associated NlpC family hydrolase